MRFMTGTSAVSSLGRKITVEFDGLDGCIFSSTCLLSLHLPPEMESYKMFKEAMRAVIAVSAQQQQMFNIPSHLVIVLVVANIKICLFTIIKY